jgi:hypothetical protein
MGYSGNIQGTFRELSGNIQGTFRDPTGGAHEPEGYGAPVFVTQGPREGLLGVRVLGF